MSENRKLQTVEGAQHYAAGLMTCEFSQINSPGLYVENRGGTLLRVPADGVAPNRSPVVSVIGRDPWIVTKISEDPFLPITKARLIVADLDLPVNF